MSLTSSSNLADPFDVLLVGGGLQNGLIALAVLHAQPRTRIAIIEAGERLGGNHTWCVHARDVPERARAWFEPLIVQRWPSYDVRFPTLARTLASEYSVISSERFAQVVSQRMGANALLLGTRATDITADHVRLSDGRVLRGRVVIDARGPNVQAYTGSAGYQKFVGIELVTPRPHGVERPLMMEATCVQSDGFRFFYLLPFAPDRLLIEETRFSRAPHLDLAAGRAAVLAYAERFGGVIERVREESGVLPMPWSLGQSPFQCASPLVAGYRGGYFHPATGYSLPAAVRVADLIGTHVSAEPFGSEWRGFMRKHRAQVSYALQLNRLLFSGFAESDMWRVFERFYRLPEDLIERFYALSLSLPDRARILLGRPPRGFSLTRALSFAVSAGEET